MANVSYNNDRGSVVTGEVEYPADPASGGFFQTDYKKHDDLKQMLDSSKDSLKLEAMKRIIGMVAKGRDASDLFPAVVKNVVSKNIEVKKLVYVYLVRYAEEQQDLALLSISTFQRALKDPNQLIRASALRVLSSIRVEMIVPIVMLAIKESASDMSPYVRKTAAHAIPKLYSLDPEQKEELISVIKKLLSENTIIVIGSAVMAFSEVCPERMDLLHKNFRKLCNVLVDVDEWGQLVILNVLTRYARENFSDPNAGKTNSDDENEKPFYEEEDSEDENSDSDKNDKEQRGTAKKKSRSKKPETDSKALNSDHKRLLFSAVPLLQSRNSGVVMAVAQLYYHVGPASDMPLAAKAMIRLLRGPVEVQSVVLHSIASLTISKKTMFEPFLKTFFVRTSDPTHIKLLKLEILSNLASQSTVSTILREFQTYITSNDKAFVAATIQAIDRCASNIKSVTDTCLQGLLELLSNKDETVVAESVIVIKKLLQSEQAVDHKTIISQMVRLLNRITVGAARAAILWLLGEYRSDKVAPDVLRECAKTFTQEEDLVKLQILNLAVKLCLTNPSQTRLLAQYVFTLARYDSSYDIRDRARFLKRFIFTNENESNSLLMENAKKIFLATKPAPIIESKFKERQQYTLGSLSHYLSAPCAGYMPLPAFATDASEESYSHVLRSNDKLQENSEPFSKNSKHSQKRSNKLFYSETEESSPQSSSNTEQGSSGEDDEASGDRVKKNSKNLSKKPNNIGSNSSNCESVTSESDSDTSDSESDSSSSEDSESGSSSGSESGSSSDGETENNSSNKSETVKNSKEANLLGDVNEVVTIKERSAPATVEKEKSNLDLLLQLEDVGDALPIMTPTYGGFLSPITDIQKQIDDSIHTASPLFVPLKSTELLSKISGKGLMVLYRFTRAPHLYSNKMASIELFFSNQSNEDISNIKATTKGLSSDQSLHPFAPIETLPPGASQSRILGIDFNDTSQAAAFQISTSNGDCAVCIKPPVGELMRSITMSENKFQTEQKRLRGMTQLEGTSGYPGSNQIICERIYELANVAPIGSQGDVLRFAGQTLAFQCLVLVTINIVNSNSTNIIVNCDKMVIGSMLCNEIKVALSR